MTSPAVPHLTLLTPEQIETIHSASLEILIRAGVRVDLPEARQLLLATGGVTALDGERLSITPELVEWAIQTAPAQIDIFDRNGGPALRLGEGHTRFGLGVTNLYYQDPQTDTVTPFSRADMRRAVRMTEQLPGYEVVSTVGVVQDYPAETADLYAVLEMAANTTRPLVVLISADELFPTALELLEALTGDLARRPFVIPYVNPITPLIINAGTAGKLLKAVRGGLPVIYSNYGMAGLSTPITAAGTLALLNAELLAGLALAQAARPGASMILGSLPAFFDMRTMQDFYDPHTLLINAACAEMMAYYGLPHAGTSGSGSGWGPDLEAAGLLWMNHLTSLMGKSGLAPFVGGVFGSKVFSPALAVYAHEVIQQAQRLADGFPFDEDMLGLDEIISRGPGGGFLDSDLTLRLYKKAYYDSRIFPRLSLDRWEERGRPRQDELLRKYTLDLIERAKAPEDQGEMVARGEAFIRSLT